jgi:hypothetical protein
VPEHWKVKPLGRFVRFRGGTTARVDDAPFVLDFRNEAEEIYRAFKPYYGATSLQIKEKACRDARVVQSALANPLDKFQIGIRRAIEDFMIQRMAENDAIVTRSMADEAFQSTLFAALAREIFESVHKRERELAGSR